MYSSIRERDFVRMRSVIRFWPFSLEMTDSSRFLTPHGLLLIIELLLSGICDPVLVA